MIIAYDHMIEVTDFHHIFTDRTLLWPFFHLLRDVQTSLSVSQWVYHLTSELQACTRGRPEPRAVRAGRGEALLKKQEFWLWRVVFRKPLVTRHAGRRLVNC